MDENDILLWPDGTWCYRYELTRHADKGDDYRVIPVGTQAWEDVVEEYFNS
jgi:hypothetical protein